jgi:lipopolysaccharide/colanic/teichoic acid biosynthesis glycosyltransferase
LAIEAGNRSFSRHKSLTGFQGGLKRLIDIAAAGAAIVLLSPLLLVIAAVIRILDGAPILYRQTRVGLDGRPFEIIKFRTMHRDAERDLGPVWAVPSDPRCTGFGYHLRRFGLDELPQLWNVLRGEMSLVGPRPERPEFTKTFSKEYPGYDLRHCVRSGITGYAQIHGWRGFTSMEERLRHDSYYVRNWSLRLDAYVLAMTMIRGWSEKTRRGV